MAAAGSGFDFLLSVSTARTNPHEFWGVGSRASPPATPAKAAVASFASRFCERGRGRGQGQVIEHLKAEGKAVANEDSPVRVGLGIELEPLSHG